MELYNYIVLWNPEAPSVINTGNEEAGTAHSLLYFVLPIVQMLTLKRLLH